MSMCDWSSDVCSSDLVAGAAGVEPAVVAVVSVVEVVAVAAAGAGTAAAAAALEPSLIERKSILLESAAADSWYTSDGTSSSTGTALPSCATCQIGNARWRVRVCAYV